MVGQSQKFQFVGNYVSFSHVCIMCQRKVKALLTFKSTRHNQNGSVVNLLSALTTSSVVYIRGVQLVHAVYSYVEFCSYAILASIHRRMLAPSQILLRVDGESQVDGGGGWFIFEPMSNMGVGYYRCCCCPVEAETRAYGK